MGQAYRINEAEISKAVKEYLFDAGGSATIAQIRRAVPYFAELNQHDRTPSSTRPGEEVWEQLVRNIVCHRDEAGNFVNKGEFIYSPGRLTLADHPQGKLFDLQC